MLAHLKKGDTVMVIAGKDKGKTGEVTEVLPADHLAKVAGVNVITRHMKPSMANPQGGKVQLEKPLPTSKLMVVCPACTKPSRFKIVTLADGQRLRACKRCNEQLAAGK